MSPTLTPYRERKLSHFWNAKSPVERLALVLENEALFWALELVTEAELKVLHATSSSNRSYVLSRESQPFFSSLNLREFLEKQTHSEKIKAALNAVFYKHKTRSLGDFPKVISPLLYPTQV